MKNKIVKEGPFLFPNYFKKIGLIVLLISFLIPIITIKVLKIEIHPSQKDIYKELMYDAIILGLIFIVWSKDKLEDEMTKYLRLKSISFAFLWVVLKVIFTPILNFIFKEPISKISGQELILNMIIVYLVIYYFSKMIR